MSTSTQLPQGLANATGQSCLSLRKSEEIRPRSRDLAGREDRLPGKNHCFPAEERVQKERNTQKNREKEDWVVADIQPLVATVLTSLPPGGKKPLAAQDRGPGQAARNGDGCSA